MKLRSIVLAVGLAALATSSSGKASAIVNGDIVKGPVAPSWIVAVHVTDLLCTGSLIDREWVLTAAHCIPKVTNPERALAVRVGTLDASEGGEQRQISAVRVHPRYKFDGSREREQGFRDIALLRLSEPATSAPIRFSTPDDRARWEPGQDVTAFGFGNAVPGVPESARVLRRADFRINERTNDGDRILSTWEGRSLCHGDSGGPQVVWADGEPRQVGVNSELYAPRCQYGRGSYASVVGDRYGSAHEWILRCAFRNECAE
ncbi:MAG: trypsin-like serine protease [Gordonia sp. (in: high G+C Gram-positive bacteria)]|uniref:S1 family peptidase n=1 Tax=Gordonia sp. (in: high G+C Gram-positive bacteria) TaxID=84139 RepID=UPI003BB5F337